jgi:BirA family biotin operon repressor/biotin-[acetyl-CoA-carboxylase] ligase
MPELSATTLQGRLQQPLYQATGWSLQVWPELPSTSDWLWQLPRDGRWNGQVAIALRQTTGRGQYGRPWQSQAGGLYLSLALSLQLPADQAPRLLFGSACGVANALRQLGVPARLKWPNDLLVDGSKLGGLLPETRIRSGFIYEAVLGLGLNIHNPVPSTGINLAAVAPRASEDIAHLSLAVLIGLAQALTVWLDLSQSLPQLLPQYRALWASLGRTIRLPDGQVGVVEDVLPSGAVQLRTPDGQRIERAIGQVCLGYGPQGEA